MVFFGTPSFEHYVALDYHKSMLESLYALTVAGVPWKTHAVAGKMVDLARNEIVDAFLKSEADDLIFVDSDVGWDAGCLGRVLASPEKIVVGMVPKRDLSCDDAFHTNAMTGVNRGGLFESLEAPTAFMRLKRCVFEEMREFYLELKDPAQTPDWPHTPYFKWGGDRNFLGEDMYFSRRWCAMGERFWVDLDITFSHRGSKRWSGNLYEHFKAKGLISS